MLETAANWISLNLSEEAGTWFQYFTNGKHLAWYASVRYTLIAALFGAMLAVLFGVLGAAARRAAFAPLRWLGLAYTRWYAVFPMYYFFCFFRWRLNNWLSLSCHGICVPLKNWLAPPGHLVKPHSGTCQQRNISSWRACR